MTHRRLSWTALVAAILLAPAARAGDAPPDSPDAASPLVRPMLHGELNLSLLDAIAMGLENNLNVEVDRYNPYIAYEDYRTAWGAYDPESYAEFGYSKVENPNANVLLGTVQSVDDSYDGFGGLRGLLPWLGSSYELQFDSSRSTTNNTISVLSPEIRSSFSVSYRQPLLRNLVWSEPWTGVKVTRVVSEAAKDDFARAVMDTVQAIEEAYWNVVAAEDEVKVAKKSHETADALLDQTQTQYEVGVVSKVDVTEAEAGVAAREVLVIRTDNTYANLQDILINQVLGPGLRADSTLRINPTDRPDDFIPYKIDIEEAVGKAFANRPELRTANKNIERAELNLKLARNQRLPQIDAVVSYGNRGLAGSQNKDFNPCRFAADPVACALAPPTVPTTNYGDTFNDYLTSNASEQYSARVLFSLPLPNTAARHTVSKRGLEYRQAMSERRRLEQNIILEVRRAARDLESAQEGIGAAERRRVAADEQLEAERIRLEYGESTPFDVLLREQDLVEAESEKINALRVYRVSTTGLDRAQGTILETRQIKIEDVGRLR